MDPNELLEWKGPFARFCRPLDRSTAVRVSVSAGLLAVLAGVASLPFVLRITELRDSNPTAIGVVAAFSIIGYTPLLFLGRMRSATLQWLMPTTTVLGLVLALCVLSTSVYLIGPTFSIAIYFVEAPLVGFLVLKRPYAIAVAVQAVVGFTLGVIALNHPVAPVEQIGTILTSAIATAALVGAFAQSLDEARTTLARINTRLRRFLAPQVADALMAGEETLAPHRAEIAVFFVDLRGFTAFTNAAEPDEVVAVLDEYYAAVGSIVDRFNGTIGGFDGDGVFAFLGDPTPNENAAADALVMAKEVAVALDALTGRWGDLGYGIGLAFGDATVGLVGFEGRIDYTAVGACVNLAARLCADAKPGEIVIDAALKQAAGVVRSRKRPSVELKGFRDVVTYGVAH